jgi:LacI family transcriptional regulator
MGERMAVTSRDVAIELGVSQSTVSRALRGDPRVAPATQVLVAEAARRMNYIPNVAARSLITARTQTVGVIVADIANPFYPQIVDSLHDELGLSGYRMVLLHERADGRRGELVPQLQGRSVDGLIFTSATLDSDAVDWFSDRGVPAVLLNRDIDGAAVDRVLSDTRMGGALAAELLARLGHRRIGLIAGPPNTSTSRDRARGFLDALERLGVPTCPELHRNGEFTYESGHQWARDLLTLPDPPSALFCGNDVMAFGALDAARRLGVSVPDQLSVVGYDDIDMAAWAAFDLSTINQPLASMAKAAARMMVSRIESDSQLEPRTQVFPASVVLRGTTAPPSPR